MIKSVSRSPSRLLKVRFTATEKRENEQNMKREDNPIPKEGQLEGQIDIFHLEMWKI